MAQALALAPVLQQPGSVAPSRFVDTPEQYQRQVNAVVLRGGRCTEVSPGGGSGVALRATFSAGGWRNTVSVILPCCAEQREWGPRERFR
eukprot:2076103-Pyramimonas_sp.AAC.1